MEATFFEYLDMETAKKNVPVLNMITVSEETLYHRARILMEAIWKKTDDFHLNLCDCYDQVGGGSAPTVRLNGKAVTVYSQNISAERLERLLRKAEIPVIVRVSQNVVMLSVRTIKDSEFDQVAEALAFAARQ